LIFIEYSNFYLDRQFIAFSPLQGTRSVTVIYLFFIIARTSAARQSSSASVHINQNFKPKQSNLKNIKQLHLAFLKIPPDCRTSVDRPQTNR
jgi:hypothetical protein